MFEGGGARAFEAVVPGVELRTKWQLSVYGDNMTMRGLTLSVRVCEDCCALNAELPRCQLTGKRFGPSSNSKQGVEQEDPVNGTVSASSPTFRLA